MNNRYKFNKSSRYMTRGINEKIPLTVQILLWKNIDDLVKSDIKTDYLQVFTFEITNKVILTHYQEQPEYKKVIEYPLKEPFANLDNVKIYVIDDITHSTMLLASEYYSKMKVENKKPLTVDQLTVAKVVASRLGLEIKTVTEVIEMEQKTTMSYVKRGYKVTKKNYITLLPVKKKGYSFESGLNGKHYEVPERRNIQVKIGDGFKNYVSHQLSLPNRLCRFVDQK